VHYEACREEYEAMLDFAGLEPGWRVLDAGCGSGSFLPSIRQRVGSGGSLFAFDTAVENLAFVEANIPSVASFSGAGSVAALPFADGCLDSVWCANTLQFLDETETAQAIDEFRRVVRPDGIVAVKDVDMTAWKLSPAPPLIGPHLAEACITGENVAKESHGSLRGRELRAWLERAGLVDVRQRSFLIERWAPLAEATALLYTDWLPYLAALAERRGVPDEDLAVWRQMSTPELARRFVERPDFYACELQVVATGRVPPQQSQ
jgi:ubiquinone/menaquinone biosynthesis C-methylase UbiE